VPVGSLVWKAGTPPGQTWSAGVTLYHLRTTLSVRGQLIGESILWALVAGLLLSSAALIACWVAGSSPRVRTFVLLLAVTAWVIPGPIIGIGLKETINLILDTTHSKVLADALYYGPSPLPLLWAYSLRFLPAALALLWPIVRLIPRELIESAQVDGATPTQELTRVVWPLTRLPWLRAGLAVAVLALGELSASKLVETPGSQTFAHEVFTQMHFGVTEDLAALCLWLLIAVLAGAIAVAVFRVRSPSLPGSAW
jgi:iron(III) transport system permease protein